MLQSYQFALFINKGTSELPEYFRIMKSETLTIAMNAETQDFKYIADEVSTTELKYYKPQIAQDLTMNAGEADYDYFFDKFFNLAAGTDADTDALLVFYAEEETAENTFKAWSADCGIVFDNVDAVAGKINFNLNFNGEINQGSAVVTDGTPVFTATV